MRIPGAVEARVQLVPIDGNLVKIIPTFEKIAVHVLERPLVVDPQLDPPHTILRMAESAGLSWEETLKVEETIRKIPDFYRGLPKVTRKLLPQLRTAQHRNRLGYVFWAERLSTRGEPVLIQTARWLQKVAGFNDPIVYVEVT